MRKKANLFIGIATCACLAVCITLVSFTGEQKSGRYATQPVGEEEEGPEKEARIRAYFELIHRAAPGTNWRAIETQNALNAEQFRVSPEASKTAAAFAGGQLNGTWYERGNNSTAGRMSSFAYNAASNSLYGMSDAGTLWSTVPPNGGWTLLNDKYKLRSKALEITPIAGGTRILMALDSQLVYSDNGGTSIQGTSGITYATSWGGNYVDKIISVNDASHSVYALVQGWNASPWAARVWLYRSTDSGKSYSKIHTFLNTSAGQVSLYSPYNSDALYALAVNSSTADSLYKVSGSTVSLLNATTSFPSSSSQAVLTGMVSGLSLQLYALIDDNKIFASTDSGAAWTSVNTLSTASWHVLSSSTKVAGNLFYGNVEAYRSTTGGSAFTKINNWADYYPAPASKLHADIQAISFFQDAGGNEFCVVGTDGGAYYSNNYLATVSNMSLTGLRVNQLWHHITHPNNPSVLYSGMQDQGLCYTTSAVGTGLITQKQEISGDYGQMRITAGDILWAEYPGGVMYLYSNLTSPQYRATYTMGGSQKSNGAWLMPTCALPGINDDILLGGGNISGGSGSFIAKLSFNGSTVAASQYPFNFRAASNNGTSGVSVIAISEYNHRMWYAATEDGTFFWSSDAGANWSKTASFGGVSGFWLYGSAIAASKKNRGTVYYGGSGYSNPGVYVSRDSGLSFTPMSTGLPKTLVNSLAVSPGDSMIFAATDAGPYVYMTAQQQWYPLIDATTPGSIWRTVEYIPSINTARFSTYGRGVWDLIITNIVTPPNSVSSLSKSRAEAYPNPAQSGGLISVKGLAQVSSVFAIQDMNGRTLYQGDCNGSGPIRLPGLPAGMYVYTVRQEGHLYKGKLSIQ
jgi:hypothetical protein